MLVWLVRLNRELGPSAETRVPKCQRKERQIYLKLGDIELWVWGYTWSRLGTCWLVYPNLKPGNKKKANEQPKRSVYKPCLMYNELVK